MTNSGVFLIDLNVLVNFGVARNHRSIDRRYDVGKGAVILGRFKRFLALRDFGFVSDCPGLLPFKIRARPVERGARDGSARIQILLSLEILFRARERGCAPVAP